MPRHYISKTAFRVVWFVGQLSSISIKMHTDQMKNQLQIEIQTLHNCVHQLCEWLPACSSHTLCFCSFFLVWDTGVLLLNHSLLYCAPVITALSDPADPNCHLLEDSCCLIFGLSDLEMFYVWCFQTPFPFYWLPASPPFMPPVRTPLPHLFLFTTWSSLQPRAFPVLQRLLPTMQRSR